MSACLKRDIRHALTSTTMEAGISRLVESYLGPPSESIHLSDFIRDAHATRAVDNNRLENTWLSLSQEQKFVAANECSVDDVKGTLEEAWNDPVQSSFLLKEHDKITASFGSSGKPSKFGRKVPVSETDTLPSEAELLRQNMDDIRLSSWILPSNAGLFVRTSRISDQNAYNELKFAKPTSGGVVEDENQAVVIITVYDRVSWSPCNISRLSRHAFLSSQTLQDVCITVPCSPYPVPAPSASDSSTRNYCVQNSSSDSGCVLCIEGLAYGDGKEGDYADKLMKHVEIVSRSKIDLSKASTSLGDTRISSLSLRINEPYWMLHRGNCEHFLVIEQIRLLNPSDPRSGYPVTLQLTPQLLDICRACTKSPAHWCIVGDIRLGESPSFLCGPCWRSMGQPDDFDSLHVEVLPLVDYLP